MSAATYVILVGAQGEPKSYCLLFVYKCANRKVNTVYGFLTGKIKSAKQFLNEKFPWTQFRCRLTRLVYLIGKKSSLEFLFLVMTEPVFFPPSFYLFISSIPLLSTYLRVPARVTSIPILSLSMNYFYLPTYLVYYVTNTCYSFASLQILCSNTKYYMTVKSWHNNVGLVATTLLVLQCCKFWKLL